jgi:hypothetical protein
MLPLLGGDGSGRRTMRRSAARARERHGERLGWRLQPVMEAQVIRDVERVTGRTVTGFTSNNHIDPDLAVEVFRARATAVPRRRALHVT